MKTRQNTPPLVAGMNGERGSRGCNLLERGFQRGCRPLWSRAGLMPRLRSAPARSVEDTKGGALLRPTKSVDASVTHIIPSSHTVYADVQ